MQVTELDAHMSNNVIVDGMAHTGIDAELQGSANAGGNAQMTSIASDGEAIIVHDGNNAAGTFNQVDTGASCSHSLHPKT